MSNEIMFSSGSISRRPVILTIDTDTSSLTRISQHLQKIDAEILMAKDVTIGLDLARLNNPDLILLNVFEPVVDGFETCRRLQANKVTANIPVIFMTARDDTKNIAHFFTAGAVDYVTKPIQQEELLARVGIHLRFRKLTDKLKITNELLEKRVQQRTVELARANEELMLEMVERREIEDALRESEEKYRRILDNAALVVFIKDLDGKYLYINTMFEKLHNITEEQILGMTDADIFPQELARQFRENDLKVLQSGNAMSIEEKVPIAKAIHTVLSTKFPLPDQDGKVYAICGIAADITDKKHAEEENARLQTQLLQSQKLESIGRLAGGVAHDFNNMLGVILGHAELAMEQMDRLSPLHADLLEIQGAAQRSADLTRQLLAFARLQAVTPKVLDLNETIGGLLKMLTRLIGEDIELAWIPGAKIWQVKIDPAQIGQIMANLTINARDAIAGVGRLIIKTTNISYDADYCRNHPDHSPGDYVQIMVSDSGCGMDRETLDSLFEPFFTTKTTAESSGLGLATVYGIVRQNRGFISVSSKPGSGTTFNIHLPRLLEDDAGKLLSVPAESIESGGETVLLVEDEPAILNMTATMLKRLGYSVLTASAPGQAIRQAKSFTGTIHLLITDVIMPEMNGRELAERLLSERADMKQLFMSGYTADVITERGVLNTGVHFIQKPFSKSELAAKVREALDASIMKSADT